MTTLVKLTEPGSSHTLTVSGVSVNEDGKWPDYNLTNGTDTIVIPKSAADRQLERMKLATAYDLIGSTVKVSRSEKPGANGKHFWNLDLVNAREATAAPSKRLPPPSVHATEKRPQTAGAHIPDMDGPPDWSDVPDAADVYEPPKNAREQAEQSGGVDFAKINKRKSFITFYADTYKMLAGLLPTQDAQAIQAATATCIIQLDRKGLLP